MATDEVKQLLSEGAQLFKEGKLQEAIVKLKAAVDADPGSVQAHAYLGAAYAQDGQGPASVEQFQAVVDLDPTSPTHTFNLGQAYEKAGSKPRAIALYEKALALDPKYARAQQRLDVLAPRQAPTASTSAVPMAPPRQAAAPTASMPAAPAPGGPMPPLAPLGGGPRPSAQPAPPQGAPTQYGAQPTYGPGSQYGPPPGPSGYNPNTYDPSLGLGLRGGAYKDYSASWKRLVAAIIDGLILEALYKGVGYLFTPVIAPAATTAASGMQAGGQPDPMKIFSALMPAVGALMVVNIIIGVCYFVGFNAGLGATPGKLALGMRILKTDGSKIGIGTALGRYVVQRLLATVTCGLAYIAILVNSDNRGFHDQIMDTMVVDV